MKQNVLHLSNDFPNSDLYKQLVLHLDQLGIEQTVYSAVRTEKETDFNPPELSHINKYIHNILYPHDKLLFRLKVRKIFKNISNCIDMSKFQKIHAHTLYSDGAVAFKIKKKFGIPYIVAVRYTDSFYFQKYRPDLRLRRNEILHKAERVIFLSPAQRDGFLNLLNGNLAKNVVRKSEVVPNGIDSIYLSEGALQQKKRNATLKLLYVGRFLDYKNIPSVIRVANELNKITNVKLTLVGGGEKQKEIEEMIKLKPYIDYLGVIRDKNKLRGIYQDNDLFIMVSRPETFGLVYIEALSQGMPIIHTQGWGVGGYFEEETIAEAVNDPNNIDEIVEKVEVLANRLDEGLRQQCIKEAQKFNWPTIAEQYKSLYESR